MFKLSLYDQKRDTAPFLDTNSAGESEVPVPSSSVVFPVQYSTNSMKHLAVVLAD